MRSQVRFTGGVSRPVRASLCAVVMAGAVLGLAGPAFAAKGGGNGTTGGTAGSCSVAPNPVAVAGAYTLTGSNLGAYAIVNVLITDSAGTEAWVLQADASGSTSVTSYAHWAGTSSVKFLKSVRHGSTVVASCSFLVV